jgi:tetratricopeptide (TPR) repeat protein
VNSKEDIVKNFIQKVNEIQNKNANEDFSSAELKQIAHEMGMSENDWEKVQKTYTDHLKRGKGFLSLNNFDDALAEYQQAYILHPDDVNALFGLASAYEGRYLESKSRTNKEMAEKYATRCLQISPDHQKALRLISSLKRKTKTPTKKRTSLILILGISAVLIGLIALAFLVSF